MLGLNRRTGKAQVSKMETGHYRSGPGFVRLLDYLRACGCGIDSLLDILDRHTARETVREEQAAQAVRAAIADMPDKLRTRALYYDIGVKHSTRQKVRRAVATAERVRRAVARGRAENWESRLKRRFNQELDKLHLGWSNSLAIGLRTYGRLVFATLRRHRRATGAWRNKALARLDDWPVRMKLEPGPFLGMKAAVMELFEQMEREGQLD
jgi:hypothetical protein